MVGPCKVNVCDPPSGWSIISSAQPIAELAGTIATVLFTVVGLILVISTGDRLQPSTQDELAARQSSLYLLVPNLVGMLVASLLLSLISGELYYERASVMAIPAAAILGISTLGAFTAISWALKGYVREASEKAVKIGNLAARVILLVAIVEVSLTTVNTGYHLKVPLFGGPDWLLVLLVVFAGSLAMVVISTRLPAAHVADGKAPRIVTIATVLCLAGIGFLLGLYNLVAVRPHDKWYYSPTPLLYWVLAGSFLYLVAIGVFLLLALPARVSEDVHIVGEAQEQAGRSPGRRSTHVETSRIASIILASAFLLRAIRLWRER